MISWIIEGASEKERASIQELTMRMLFINFAAIHTSSNVGRFIKFCLTGLLSDHGL